jgi:hypothetical protein
MGPRFDAALIFKVLLLQDFPELSGGETGF